MVEIDRNKLIPYVYIIITICYLAFSTIFILKIRGTDYILIIRGRKETDLLITFVGIPLIMCLLTFFIRPITLINFKITRKFQRNYNYYYVDLRNRPFASKRLIQRALIPVMVSIAISLLINSFPYLSGTTIDPISSIIILAFLLSPIVSVLFIPLWVFKDSGIVKVRKRTDERIPPDMHFYGKAQYQSWKGFAGITTPITYFIIMFPIIMTSAALIVLLFPLFLIGFYMPMLLLYEKKIDKISDKILQKLNLPLLNIDDVERSFF